MKNARWAAVLAGVGAIALVVYRVLSGQWTMAVIIVIGVVAGLGALLLWLLWDRRLFRSGIRRAADPRPESLVIGGYLVEAGLRNVQGARPPRAEIVLSATVEGIRLFDPRRATPDPVLGVRWDDVFEVTPGEASLFGEQRKALVVHTLEGRLVLVLRGNEKRGVLSAGDAEAEAFVGRLRELRGGHTHLRS